MEHIVLVQANQVEFLGIICEELLILETNCVLNLMFRTCYKINAISRPGLMGLAFVLFFSPPANHCLPSASALLS